MNQLAPAIDSIASTLGPAYCISLVSRPERRCFCQRQFVAEGIDVSLFDAIVPTSAGRFPSLGAHGCYQSHMRVLAQGLKDCQRVGTDRMTIFEDDVLLPRSFSQIVLTVAPQLETLDWNFFYWGTQNNPPTTPVAGHDVLAEIAPEQTIIGKQAYTIRTAVVPELLDYLRACGNRPTPGYSDGMFHEFRLAHGLPAHTHTFTPARQGSFQSNITPLSYNWMRQPVRAVKRQVQLWTR